MRTTLLGTIVLCLSTLAPAQGIIWSAGGTPRTDGGMVAGSLLNNMAPASVNALGFVDVGADGLAGSYSVGLWDSAGTLLASATVTPASPLVGDFRWTPIAPVTLPAGQFTVGALLPANPADAWLDHATLVLASGFTGAGEGRYVAGGSLAFPATADSGNNYIVANAGALSIPEPSSGLALLGLAAALPRRRRR